jgi:hypothetical protein
MLDRNISVKQLYDMLEILDTHDAMKKIAYDKAQAEAKAKQKQQGSK